MKSENLININKDLKFKFMKSKLIILALLSFLATDVVLAQNELDFEALSIFSEHVKAKN